MKIFLTAVLAALTFASFAVHANDVMTVEEDLSVATDEAEARLWGQTHKINVYLAHACSHSDTASQCAVPKANMSQPAVYAKWWSPQAQTYTVYVIIADSAGAVSFLNVAGIGAGAGIVGVKLSSATLAGLSPGYYYLTVIVAGQSAGGYGVAHQYYFHTG